MTPPPRTVLITGAAGGIGSATAKRFYEQGWAVLLTDLDQAGLHRVSGELGGAPIRAADLRRKSACDDIAAWAASAAPRLDALVNAAGVWREGPTAEIEESDLDLVLDVNVKATILMSAAVLPRLVLTEGSIVNVASDAGLQGNAGAAAYCASKGGVVLFTKALALEAASSGVRVNAVCPGDVDTPMLAFQAQRYGFGDPAAYLRRLIDGYPQGPGRARFVRADEVASLIFYLAGAEATAITGAALSIDFGYSAGR